MNYFDYIALNKLEDKASTFFRYLIDIKEYTIEQAMEEARIMKLTITYKSLATTIPVIKTKKGTLEELLKEVLKINKNYKVLKVEIN